MLKVTVPYCLKCRREVAAIHFRQKAFPDGKWDSLTSPLVGTIHANCDGQVVMKEETDATHQ